MTTKPVTARDRLLEVIRILQEYTDDKTMLTIHDIHSFFPEHVKVGIGAVRDDIQSLENSIAFPVVAVQQKNGLPKRYYYDGQLFEIHELRLLMDAISAAKFIPRRDTNQLLMKIRKLTSRSLAKQLTNELVVAEQSTQGAVEIISTVQLLHEAIHDKRIVAFQYGRYETNLQFVVSHEGNDYFVKPLGLVWNNDRYYLVAHFMQEDEIRQYRVDRMRNVRILDEQFVTDPYFDLHVYTSKMIHMFGGDMISLEAKFHEKLINVVIDRFGLDANIVDQQDGTFLLKAQVAMSEGPVRWLFRWGGDVKVLHPTQLVERMKQESEKMYEQYR
ncbi:WYL domain-containing protein [Filibacter tadaridae]|uniref:Uncharacterized protein n=1 Tax=Filibacter tadaridae TaxID=2483811 RepID=A0A3P5X2M3_9BACL|nr:WYL domain-containing protein [Filibacter tadaridae]VDC28210.1 hypothetical protein FILTAD_01825 [Filibacter tadaridae]